MSEKDILATVDEDLWAMPIWPKALPPKVLGVEVWPRTIHQYKLRHLDMMTELRGGGRGQYGRTIDVWEL
jgi:hypothetical protein